MKVKFDMTEHNWSSAVVAANENIEVVEETTEHFIIYYRRAKDFYSAQNRFDLYVSYNIIED